MATIKEIASNYESPTTRNIVELEVVRSDSQIEERTGKDSDGKEFHYNVITVNNFEYRVPNSVLTNLKEILNVTPGLIAFRVTKKGEGLNTKYTVVPLS